MLAVIIRPFDGAAAVVWEAPPAAYGEETYGPDPQYTTYGAETVIHLADRAYTGKPSDDGTIAAHSAIFQSPPAPYGGGDGGEGGEYGPTQLDYDIRFPATTSPDAPNVANVYFAPRLQSSFNLALSLFEGDEPRGRARPGLGEMRIVNADGALDEALAQGWDGRPIDFYEGAPGAAFAAFARRYRGTCDGIVWDETGITVRLRDPQLRMDQPIQTRLYAGTGGLEGGAELAGVVKPLAFGFCENVAGIPVDPANLVYHLHDGAIKSVAAVRDKGVALAASLDHADYAALVAATIAAGSYATCLAEGLVRLGASPAGLVTVDLEGDNSNGVYVADSAGIVARIASQRLPAADRFGDPDGLDSNALAAFTALQPAEIGFVVQSPASAGAVADEIMAAAGGVWFVAFDGRLAVARLDLPSASPAATLKRHRFGALERRGAVPRWRTRIGYRRMWSVQSKDDLAGAVSEEKRALYSEDYRYAVAITDGARETHKRARDVVVAGFFRHEADAAAEAARQQALFGALRHIYRVRVDAGPFDRALGDIVALDGVARFGWTPPKSFVLVGIDADAARGETSYDLWA